MVIEVYVYLILAGKTMKVDFILKCALGENEVGKTGVSCNSNQELCVKCSAQGHNSNAQCLVVQNTEYLVTQQYFLLVPHLAFYSGKEEQYF